MSILKQALLVESRKSGRWVYYRLAGDEAPTEVRDAIAWVNKSLKEDPKALKDIELLREILKFNPEELCKRENNN
jgi:DNA-binding transcriptional ArsR family regulator